MSEKRSCNYNSSTFKKMLWSCFIESILTFTFINRFGLLNLKNKKRLLRIAKVCCKVVGATLNDLTQLYRCRVTSKAPLILSDPSRPLAVEFLFFPSGCRYWLPWCRKNSLKNSFVTVAINLLNEWLGWWFLFCCLFCYCCYVPQFAARDNNEVEDELKCWFTEIKFDAIWRMYVELSDPTTWQMPLCVNQKQLQSYTVLDGSGPKGHKQR